MRSVSRLFLFLIRLNEIKSELQQGGVSWNLKCTWVEYIIAIVYLLIYLNISYLQGHAFKTW